MSNPISFSLQIFGDVGRNAVLGAQLTKIRIITSALQDERDDQILFTFKMPQQGSVEALDLSSKPFGHAQRVTVAARHFAGKRGNKLTACGAEANDLPGRSCRRPANRLEQIASEPRGHKRARNGRLRFCSLIPCSWFFSSLLSKIFSLLSFVGNWLRNRCSTAVSYSEVRSSGPEIAKFPVKFPDSREFVWRRVPLRRQPGVFGEFCSRGRRAVGHHGGRVVWSR